MIILFVVIAFESLCITPATFLLMKLIDKPMQPFALGVMKCMNILIGFIPTPIFLSQLIDKTCILWNNECIGDKGTCLEYNPSNFHFTLFGVAAVVKVISCFLIVIFSLHIHKAYVLKRRYRSHVTLNHGERPLTPKEKSRIDSIVASMPDNDASSETVSNSSRSILALIMHHNSAKTGENSGNNNGNNKNGGVVLRMHRMYGDDFSLIDDRSALNESIQFTNLEELDKQLKQKEEQEQRDLEQKREKKREKQATSRAKKMRDARSVSGSIENEDKQRVVTLATTTTTTTTSSSPSEQSNNHAKEALEQSNSKQLFPIEETEPTTTANQTTEF